MSRPLSQTAKAFAGLSALALLALSLGGCALAPAARVGAQGPMMAKLEGEPGADITPRAAPSPEARAAEASTLKPSSSEGQRTTPRTQTQKRASAQKRGSGRSAARPVRPAPKREASRPKGAQSGQKDAAPQVDQAEEAVAESGQPDTQPSIQPSVRPPSFDARVLSRDECAAFLAEQGIEYERAEGPDNLALYLRPQGAIGGVLYEFDGRSAVHEVMDCRLVAALVQWGPRLRSLGIEKVRHISAYRPGARVARTGKRSGHASALAIDLRFIELEDGRVLDVLEHWGDRRKGAAPCEDGRGAGDPHPELRQLVCETIDDGIFQTIITPHRDTLHDNHVHLELVPEVEWTYVR